MIARQALACLLIALLAVPAESSPANAIPAVVGQVTSSRAATLRSITLQVGTTIFAGDTVFTDTGGDTLITVASGAQVQLGAETAASLEKSAGRVQVELRQGQIWFSTTAASPVEARLADARVFSDGPAIGVVALRNSSAGVIAARKGSLTVQTAHDGRMVTLQEGEGVEVTLVDAKPDTSAQSSPRPLSRRKVAVLIIVLALAASLIWLKFHNRELTAQQRQDLITPYRIR